MKLAHLKLKGDEKESGPGLQESDEAAYPHGMRIRADHHTMKKLGMHETPAPGHKVHFEGHGVVVGSHQHPTNKEDRHVEIQFTHGGAEHKADEVPEKSLRDEIGEAHKNAKPIEPRKERAVKAEEKGKDAGKRPGAAVEPAGA